MPPTRRCAGARAAARVARTEGVERFRPVSWLVSKLNDTNSGATVASTDASSTSILIGPVGPGEGVGAGVLIVHGGLWVAQLW